MEIFRVSISGAEDELNDLPIGYYATKDVALKDVETIMQNNGEHETDIVDGQGVTMVIADASRGLVYYSIETINVIE